MRDILFAWPHELPAPSPLLGPAQFAAVKLRLQDLPGAEYFLLSHLPSTYTQSDLDLFQIYLLLLLKSQRYQSFCNLVAQYPGIYSQCALHNYLQASFLLGSGSPEDCIAFLQSVPDLSSEWELYLLLVECEISLGHSDRVDSLLTSPPQGCLNTLEYTRLRASFLESILDFDTALSLLIPCLEKFPQHIGLTSQVLTLTLEARSQEHSLPLLKKALATHGAHPAFFAHLCRVNLYLHRHADAFRYSLLDRLTKYTRSGSLSPLSNIYIALDRLGLSEWIQHSTYTEATISTLPLPVKEAMLMQYACIGDSKMVSPILSDSIQSEYRDINSRALSMSMEPKRLAPPSLSRPLRVAWISADIAYHPVSRFIYGMFSSKHNASHNHYLVDIDHHKAESTDHLFKPLTSVNYINLGHGPFSKKYIKIRELQADIAIDLNGWTSGHFQRGFFERIAPVQINYLGYFASTFNPSTDYWLADSVLFGPDYCETHTEKLLRLNRCFLSWQPPLKLEESKVQVTERAKSNTLNFGSFNHVRKISSSTLKLWSLLLKRFPNSRLVLKASRVDDPSTMHVLRQRMIRASLDPELVIWLPRSSTATEHLQQYQHLDIALDPFPNGGCTTTCEALWMGVPVVTLTGTSYASRMSTAVLHGANHPELCASTFEEFLNAVTRLVSQINQPGYDRSIWRQSILTSPLGDASSLFSSIEQVLSDVSTT